MTRKVKCVSFIGKVLLTAALCLPLSLSAPWAQESESTTETLAVDNPNRVTAEGLTIEFRAGPILGSFEEQRPLFERDYANLNFSITDANSGEPVRGLIPGAWVDLIETFDGSSTQKLSCKERVGLYLRGSTGTTPLIDINSYFILAMNADATISVIDPNILVAGVGDLFHSLIILPRPGGDWVQTKDQDRVFVSMPQADTVGVIDTKDFRLTTQIHTGREPLRVALQPDERYLWVGYNAKTKTGGVTVIDLESLEVAKTIETGKGHHEIAIDDDNRFALVTNRKSGTVTAIDIGTLEIVKTLPVGEAPVSIGYSSQSRAFYISDGASGRIHVLDGRSLESLGEIAAKPGLGPMRVTGDGRWVLVTNATANLLHVIDSSSNRVVHDIPIEGRPFQVSVTRAFAYVRSLDSERLSLLSLGDFGKAASPPVVRVPLGEKAPNLAKQLSIADGIVEAAGEAGVVAVDPAEGTLAFYMEGMNAPMGSFRSKGHSPRAVMVTDRALLEEKPGVYSAQVLLPKAGEFEVAFLLDAPPVLKCFTFDALVNPNLKQDHLALGIEYLLESRKILAGEPYRLQVRLTNPADGSPRTGLTDVSALYYLAPGGLRKQVSAKELGDGIYELELETQKTGTYYVYIGSPSHPVPANKVGYLTLIATEQN